MKEGFATSASTKERRCLKPFHKVEGEVVEELSQHKECVSEISGVKREFSRREYQANSQTQGEISRWLSPLKIKTGWREAQSRVTEYSGILWQEGIEPV